MAGQPITAARETVARDGLAGALGYGVIDAGTASSGVAPVDTPEREEIGGVPVPAGGLPAGAPDPVAGDELDPAGRWTGPLGFTLEGEVCGAPPYTAALDFCPNPADEYAGRPGGSHTFGTPNALIAALEDQRAFIVGAGVECSTFGTPDDLEPWRAAARRALELSQWSQVANELWTGDRARASGWTANRRLASPDATVLAGGQPVGLVEAIAALEDAFGSCSYGAVQLIHTPRKLSAYLDAAGIIETSPGSGRLWTANDSLVIADRGYPGTGPNGQAPEAGTAWLYSTGVLTARLGRIRYPERDHGDAVHATTNDVIVHAERPAAIAWLCCHFAVNVCYG